MAEGFDAGSIFFALRAQIQDVQKNIQTVERTLDSLGSGVRSAAQQVQTGGEEISTGLQTATLATNNFNAKLAGTITRVIALQTVITQLSDQFGETEFAQEVRAGANALLVFSTAVALIPGPIGLVIGVIGGLTTAILGLMAVSRELLARQKELSAEFKNTIASATAWQLQLQDLNVVAKETSDSSRRIRDSLQILEDALLSNLVASQRLTVEIQDLEKEQKKLTDLFSDEAKALRDSIITRTAELAIRSIQIQSIRFGIKEITREDAALEGLTERMKTLKETLEDGQAIQAEAIKLGLIDPFQAATVNAQQLRTALFALLQIQEDLRREGIEIPEKLRLRIQQLRFELDPQQPGFTQAQLEFQRSFAQPLSENLGQALFDGILEGKKAIEILGDFAENVFSRSLSTAIEGFQKGMSDVLTEIAGSAGGVIGNILTGVAGVAAGIFLNRQGESTNTFSEVQSRIESTQAVRGVVAGPTSIPIASVGSNLERAFVPVNERLDAMIEHLRGIESNTSGGPPAGGAGFGLAGGVPTA